MKKVLFTILILAFAVSAWAQGPFNDVPTDHWAYDAINKLQQDGALIGYPDGTFSGKRSLTRYEFATAIARVLATIKVQGPQDLSNYVTKDQLPTVPGDLVTKGQLPDFGKFVSKEDLGRVSRLVNEFKDELAALGVDVDALKRDVAALDARVTILENEMKRVKITGTVNIFGISTKDNYSGPNAIDLDGRTLPKSGLLNNITFVKDFDLNVVGRVNSATTAVATINYGSYLNYLGAIDDYVGGTRPTSKNVVTGNGGNLGDTFFPYYMYIDTACGGASVTAGRFPLQFTPYTLKKVDVDSYTSILKTDDGNYPVDGIQLAQSLYGVDLTLFAAKHDTNQYLVNGLTGQPSSGIGALNQIGGHSVGGLNALIDQSAGARVKFGVPFGGNMGLTYYQAYSSAATGYDQARVFGADMSVLVAERYNLVGSWTRSDALAIAGADVTKDNVAWDAKVQTGFGKLGVGAGYKSIDRNFAAAGSWDKVGRWDNPVNVKGPYADFTYPLQSNLKVVLNGEYLTWKETTAIPATSWGQKDDKILKAEAGVKWGISKKNALTAGYEYVQWNPEAAGDNATETYLTLGWAHDIGANAGMKVGYQFINYDNGSGTGPYGGALGNNYRGGLGVVQFGVSF